MKAQVPQHGVPVAVTRVSRGIALHFGDSSYRLRPLNAAQLIDQIADALEQPAPERQE